MAGTTHAPSGQVYSWVLGDSNWHTAQSNLNLFVLNAVTGSTAAGAGVQVMQAPVTNASSNIFKASTAASYFPSGFVGTSLSVYLDGLRQRNVTVVSATGGTFRVTENSTSGTAVAGAQYPYIYIDAVRK